MDKTDEPSAPIDVRQFLADFVNVNAANDLKKNGTTFEDYGCGAYGEMFEELNELCGCGRYYSILLIHLP